MVASVNFVNGKRPSHRVGLAAAKIINAIVFQQILNYRPTAREAGSESARKKRRTTNEVQRKDTMASLRLALTGNPNRTDIPKVFFDEAFYKHNQGKLDCNYSLGDSQYCMMTAFIGALMMLLCGMLPATTEVNEKDINTLLATGAYRAQCLMLCHCAKLLLERLPDHRRELLIKCWCCKPGPRLRNKVLPPGTQLC